MGTFNITVLPGDGIGPEVMAEALKALHAIETKWEHTFTLTEDLVGGVCIDTHGTALREETLATARAADAVLFGAVGGPKWDDPRADVRPEQGLLAIRKGLGLFANVRPVKVEPLMRNASTLKPEVLDGVDMVVIRELTGGLYYGEPKRRWQDERGRHGVDTMYYSEAEVRRVVRFAFDLARGRRKHVTSVDKANVLEVSRMWREVASEVGEEYPDVELRHLLVDSCAMDLIRRPAEFDVIVTENTFGDILTDEASMLVGSMGMLPSASLGERTSTGGTGLYEPIHGTAPDIAGQGKANPLAMLLSTAMMLRLSLNLPAEADALEAAVAQTLADGFRTVDIAEPGTRAVSTEQMGDEVVARLSAG